MVVYGVVDVVCWEVQCVVYGCLYDYTSMDQVVYVCKMMGYKLGVMLRLMMVLLLKAVIYHKEYLPSKNNKQTWKWGADGSLQHMH